MLSFVRLVLFTVSPIELASLLTFASVLLGLFTVSPIELASGYALGAVASVGGGGSLSLQIRTLLVSPGLHTESYYGVVTYHALLMIFAWVMPLLFGVIANAMLPTFVGISDLLLPRLNSVGMWLLLDSVVLLLECQAIPSPIGWTMYVPLSLHEGAGVDWAIISLHLAGMSSLILAINLLTTTYCSYQARLPWRAISLVMWSTNVANVLLVLTLPALAAAITMLLLDRRLNTGYYCVEHGGDPILYQHIFWFFG